MRLLVFILAVATVDVGVKACEIPRFDGDWEPITPYPIPAAEAQGQIIGSDLVLVSGFSKEWDFASPKVYSLDLTDPCPDGWTERDEVPVPQGLTHAAALVVPGTNEFYLCGGYVGGHPGVHTTSCLVFDNEAIPGSQWDELPRLPAGRAGGGMVYDSLSRSLVYASGAQRTVENGIITKIVDFHETWKLRLDNLEEGWVQQDNLPFAANHMSCVTGKDETGVERHFVFGGQLGEDVHCSNVNDNYEWNGASWIQRRNLPFTRGHTTASVRPVSCGFIVVGGATNEHSSTRDISYYDIPSDTWTSIGELPRAINSVVCDIDRDHGYLYCLTGHITKSLAYKRRIDLASFGVSSPRREYKPKNCPSNDCDLLDLFCQFGAFWHFVLTAFEDLAQKNKEWRMCGCNCQNKFFGLF